MNAAGEADAVDETEDVHARASLFLSDTLMASASLVLVFQLLLLASFRYSHNRQRVADALVSLTLFSVAVYNLILSYEVSRPAYRCASDFP